MNVPAGYKQVSEQEAVPLLRGAKVQESYHFKTQTLSTTYVRFSGAGVIFLASSGPNPNNPTTGIYLPTWWLPVAAGDTPPTILPAPANLSYAQPQYSQVAAPREDPDGVADLAERLREALPEEANDDGLE